MYFCQIRFSKILLGFYIKKTIVILVIAINLNISLNILAGEVNYDKSLAKKIIEFHKELSSAEKQERVKILKDFFPKKQNFKILFPEHGKVLWNIYKKHIDLMLENTVKITSRYRKNNLVKITTH